LFADNALVTFFFLSWFMVHSLNLSKLVIHCYSAALLSDLMPRNR